MKLPDFLEHWDKLLSTWLDKEVFDELSKYPLETEIFLCKRSQMKDVEAWIKDHLPDGLYTLRTEPWLMRFVFIHDPKYVMLFKLMWDCD